MPLAHTKTITLNLLPRQADWLRDALDLAIEDCREHLRHCYVEMDYRGDDTGVADLQTQSTILVAIKNEVERQLEDQQET